MKVVLADVELDALTRVENELRATGASVLAVLTDVSSAGDVQALAQKTIEAFGAVHLLCNNAGVVQDGSQGWNIWDYTLDDWQWIVGVNLWGVIHGVRTFVPVMLEQDTPCHIVNTASIAGLLSPPYFGIYNVTKHAIVTLTESLHRELRLRKTKIRVSVLCPAWVNTQINDSARNRPAELGNRPADKVCEPDDGIQDRESYFAALYARYEPGIRQQLQQVLDPEDIADSVIRAVANDEFYIFTHPGWQACLRNRCRDILEQRIPDVFL